MNFWAQVRAIAWKDLLSELRTREIIFSILGFALLVLVVFNFAFSPDRDLIIQIAPGLLWVTFVFSGVLALNRTFIPEKEENCIEGLLCCPVKSEAIYVGKALGGFFFLIIIELIVLGACALLFDLSVIRLELFVVILLATIGFVSVGTLFSAVAVNTRAREMVLPILFLPVITPVIIAAVKATGIIFEGDSWKDLASWIVLLASFDIIFLVVPLLIFPYVIEE